MTDDEIIEALEAEIHYCEYFDDSRADGISLEFLKDTLAYINRQKAEIERLKRSLDNMTDALIRTDDYCRAVEHSETLLKERDNGIREFAEKLIEETRTFSEYDESGWECDVSAISAEEIDRIAKEMTEGDKMQDTMNREQERSRLIDLTHEAAAEGADSFTTVIPRPLDFTDQLADYLLANDVTLVKHGIWKCRAKHLGECSECGEVVAIRYKYCPNCGARMDGDRE